MIQKRWINEYGESCETFTAHKDHISWVKRGETETGVDGGFSDKVTGKTVWAFSFYTRKKEERYGGECPITYAFTCETEEEGRKLLAKVANKERRYLRHDLEATSEGWIEIQRTMHATCVYDFCGRCRWLDTASISADYWHREKKTVFSGLWSDVPAMPSEKEPSAEEVEAWASLPEHDNDWQRLLRGELRVEDSPVPTRGFRAVPSP
jgi:hypothetical protein